MKYTNKALEEQATYNLSNNPDYQACIAIEYSACERRFSQYGYWVHKDVATRNMIKALRMMPYMNTPQDWARLHVTEAAMKLK